MKNKTVIRKVNVNGQFTTIHNSILRDKRLSPNGFRLLVNILSDSDENFKLSPTVYCDRLGITKTTFLNAITNLEECGYLKREDSKIDKSKNHYIVSEFGNLNPNQETDIDTAHSESPSTENSAVESNQTQSEKDSQEFDEYLYSIERLMNYEEFENLLLNKWVPELQNVNKAELKKHVDAYLVGFYNECLALAKNPGKHPKALKDYKDLLKKEIFTNHNLEINARNKWSILSLTKHKKPFKTDFETEMGDYYENPRD